MDEKVLDAFGRNFVAVIREAVREEVRAALAEHEPKLEPLEVDTAKAAELLSLPPSWVAAAARRGELPCVKHGHHVRFCVRELEKFIEQKKMGAPPRESEGTRRLKGDTANGNRIAGAD